MSQNVGTGGSTTPTSGARGTSGWVGWIAFAGMVMVLLGVFHIVQGLVALFNQSYFVVDSSKVVLSIGYTGWGWAHIIGGLVVLIAGICVFAGQVWARAVGVVVALVSALFNITFIAAFPVWSLIMLTLDVIIIAALTVHGSEIKPQSQA
jgi:hypothetical protein